MQCTYCHIEVGSNAKVCPLCQNQLTGEIEEEYWPSPKDLARHSTLWKVFLFICLVVCTLCFFIDYLFNESMHFHWSLAVIAWVIVVDIMLARFIKSHRSVPKIIFQSMLVFLIMIYLTGWYCGFRETSLDMIMPIVCSVTLVLNFIFSFIDAKFTESSLLYMLLNIVVGVVPYIAIYLSRGTDPVTWTITLLISVITFIGLAVFKGKTMLVEIHKRLHF